MNSSNATPMKIDSAEKDFSTIDESIKIEDLDEASDGENVIEDDDEQEEVLKEIEMKTQNYISNRPTEKEKTDVPRYMLYEDMCKAITARDNALAQYLIAKRKTLTINDDDQELCIAELKLKIKRVSLENLKLKTDLQSKG